MDVWVCGAEEDVAATGGGNDGRGDVALAATRAGVGRCDDSGQGGVQGRGDDGGGNVIAIDYRLGSDNVKRCCRYGGQRRRVGSSPAAGAMPTNAAMPLSPPTDDGDDHANEGEG